MTGSVPSRRAPVAAAVARVAPAPASASGRAGEPGELGGSAEQCGVFRSCREDDQVGAQRTVTRSARPAGCRRRGSAPASRCGAARSRRPPREVVEFARGRRPERLRPVAASPAAGQVVEPPAEQVAGEVFFADAPAWRCQRSPIAQVGQHHVAQHGLHGEFGEQAVQHGLRGGSSRSSRAWLSAAAGAAGDCGAARPGIGAIGGGVPLQVAPRRLRRRQPLREVGLMRLTRFSSATEYRPVPAGRALRLQQTVAALPGP